MNVLCAMVRERGERLYETVAMMRVKRGTTVRDHFVFRGQVRASYPGHIEFRFEMKAIKKPGAKAGPKKEPVISAA